MYHVCNCKICQEESFKTCGDGGLRKMNEYEKACREWLKGCSCADMQKPETCEECTKAFLEHIKSLEPFETINVLGFSSDRGKGKEK